MAKARSGLSKTTYAAPPSATQTPPQPQPILQPQPAPPPVVPDVIADISTWTDDELAQAVIDSRTVDMPNMLADVQDATQRFIYQIGANEKPLVLDDQHSISLCQITAYHSVRCYRDHWTT